MNLHGNIARGNAQACGNGLIVDFSDFIHFDEVVSRTQRPELIPPPFAGVVGDGKGSIGARAR